LRIIAAANALALISTALIALLMYATDLHVESCVTVLQIAPGQGLLRQSVVEQERALLQIAVLIGFGQLVLFNLAAVIVSHRIAGPLYRLQRHLKAVAAGSEPADVRFRNGDLYQELAEACNELMARMRRETTKP
jgi:signal transduction histidine kinase